MNRHNGHYVLIPILCFVVLFPAAPLTLGADKPVCIPGAEGIFGNATPPNWWDTSQTAPYFKDLDDPRWVGAARITFEDGAGQLADFRALHGSEGGVENLYLSWRVHFSILGTHTQEHMYVGFRRPPSAGGGAVIIDISPLSDLENAAVPGQVVISPQLPDGSVNDSTTVPIAGVFATTRVWRHKPAAGTFAAQMRIPVSEIDAPGGTFPMWFGMVSSLTGASYELHWPRDPSGAITPATFMTPVKFPLPGAWKSFHITTGAGDPVACAAGISLDLYQIGADHPDGPATAFDDEIYYQTTGTNTIRNRMFARPRNDSGSTIGTGELRARFRVANWGSLPGDEAGAAPGALWADVPGAEDRGNSAPIPNGTVATAANDIDFDWILTQDQITPFEDGTRARDNCLLVTLTSTTGLTFLNDSVRRNMMFRRASTITQDAEISTRTLPPFSTQGRDIYLYIEVLNMPARVDRPVPTGPTTTAVGTTAVHEYAVGKYRYMTAPSAQQLEDMAADGKVTGDEMDRTVPTYRVHVFHDTGMRWIADGVEHPFLRPQGGFGYRVLHKGDLLGWVHKTVCLDCTMQQIAPDVYRISRVPNDGVVHVRTMIEAVEPCTSSSSSAYRFFFDIGPNRPGEGFSGFENSQWSANVGVERFIRPRLSVEGIAGYHRFEGEASDFPNEIGEFCLDIAQLSLNVKQYYGSGSLHWFVNGGVGAYYIDPPETWEAGANVGAGVLYDVNSRWGIEGVYNYHRVNASPDALGWWTLQFGPRIRF